MTQTVNKNPDDHPIPVSLWLDALHRSQLEEATRDFFLTVYPELHKYWFEDADENDFPAAFWQLKEFVGNELGVDFGDDDEGEDE